MSFDKILVNSTFLRKSQDFIYISIINCASFILQLDFLLAGLNIFDEHGNELGNNNITSISVRKLANDFIKVEDISDIDS